MWHDVTLSEYTRRISGTDRDGPSPGGAARDLGVTRQAIHQAIARGRLEAYRINRDGNLIAIIVSQRSLDRYRHAASRARHDPRKAYC